MKDERVYKTVYPKRLLCPERLARLTKKGIVFCPQCGSTAIRTADDGNKVCLQCNTLIRKSYILSADTSKDEKAKE